MNPKGSETSQVSTRPEFVETNRAQWFLVLRERREQKHAAEPLEASFAPFLPGCVLGT